MYIVQCTCCGLHIYLDRTSSRPTTPLPLTVSSVPDRENVQFLKVYCTVMYMLLLFTYLPG